MLEESRKFLFTKRVLEMEDGIVSYLIVLCEHWIEALHELPSPIRPMLCNYWSSEAIVTGSSLFRPLTSHTSHDVLMLFYIYLA